MSRVVVVGAGVGGLAAAGRLAAAGHDVVVCERAAEVGGKLGVHRRDGFAFDTGPSLLTMPQVLAEALDAVGGDLEADLAPQPVEPVARYRFADGAVVDVPTDPDARGAALDAALGDGAGAQWAGLLERGAVVWRAVERPYLRQPLRASTLARRLADLPVVAPWASLADLAESCLEDPRLRTMLWRYATYAGSDPRRAPAALAAIPFAEQAFGAWYVPGGLGRIAEELARRAGERGAEVRTSAPVAVIRTDAGRVVGVTLDDGERLDADVVVANADAALVYGRLLDPAGLDARAARGVRRARRRLARAEPSLSGFVLLLGVEGATPGLEHHNVLFPADYAAEFDAVFGPDPRPVEDPTLYVVAPPDRAPPGCEAWFVLANAPRHGPVDWGAPGRVEAYRDQLLDVLARRGLDVGGRLRFAEARSPAWLAERAAAPGGAIYGSSSNGARAAFRRPANRSPAPGLFLVGGSAHPGGGLPLVLLSAAIVAAQVDGAR